MGMMELVGAVEGGRGEGGGGVGGVAWEKFHLVSRLLSHRLNGEKS